MRDGTRNKFLLCFRPVVNVDGGMLDPCNGNGTGSGNGKRQKHEQRGGRGDLQVSENVADNNSPARPRNRSLSHVLKAVMFESALTRRIRRRKGSNRKTHSARMTGRPLPGQVGGGFDRHNIKELETDDPPALSSGLPLESKCTGCTGDEIMVLGYASETSGVTSHETKELELVQGPADKRRPRRLAAAALSLLNHCGIHVSLMVVGVTVAWGKTCAILFTSIWLYSILFRRIARRWMYQGQGDHAWSIMEPSNIEEDDVSDREGIKFFT